MGIFSEHTTSHAAVITGAGQGIGKAIAFHLAADGNAISVADIRLEAAQQTVSELLAKGYKAIAVRADVTDPASCEAAITETAERLGRVDILVNSAGISKPGPSLDVAPEDWKRMLDIQLNGTFYCCQSAGRQMVKQGLAPALVIGVIAAHEQQDPMAM